MIKPSNYFMMAPTVYKRAEEEDSMNRRLKYLL